LRRGPFEAFYLKWRCGDCAMLAAKDSFDHPLLAMFADATGVALFDRAAPGGI